MHIPDTSDEHSVDRGTADPDIRDGETTIPDTKVAVRWLTACPAELKEKNEVLTRQSAGHGARPQTHREGWLTWSGLLDRSIAHCVL